MSGAKSRFSVLNVEDGVESDSGEEMTKNKQFTKTSNKINQQKKSKKKATEKVEEARKGIQQTLKNLSSAAASNKLETTTSISSSKMLNERLIENDEEYTSGQFENELNEAIKHGNNIFQEFKQTSEKLKENEEQNIGVGKKKKKEKPITMSFGDYCGVIGTTNANIKKDSTTPLERQLPDVDSKFLAQEGFFVSTKAAKDYKRKIEQSHEIEENRKITVQKDLETKKLKRLEQKRKEFIASQTSLSKLQSELQDVKLRNQQFTHILNKGEMKAKTRILTETNELKQICEEMKADLEAKNKDLELEKTTIQQLRIDIEKFKAKGNGKSEKTRR